jgi:aldehyde dehydrogenase (NAD+)
MAPRRIFLVGATQQQKSQFRERLLTSLQSVAPVRLPLKTSERLTVLLQEARALGAHVHGESANESVQPILILDGAPTMAIAQEDIFAPVLTLIEVEDVTAVINAQAACPFGLTASIFGAESECHALAEHLEVGTVFINDVIVPSADPRLPFGGRRFSGFGVTQGVEGLLEMTAIKTVAASRTSNTKHLEPITTDHAGFFTAVIRATYADRWADRMRGIKETIRTGRKFL